MPYPKDTIEDAMKGHIKNVYVSKNQQYTI